MTRIIFGTILHICAIFTLIICSGSVVFTLATEENVLKIIGKLFCICLVVLIAIIVLWRTGNNKCPQCREINALKRGETKITNKANVRAVKKMAVRDTNDMVTNYVDQQVDCVRYTYRKEYCCVKCGHVHYKNYTEDKY